MRALSACLAASLGIAVLAAGCAGASGNGRGDGSGNGASGNSAAARAAAAADTGPPAPSCVPQTLNVSAALAGGRVTVSPGPGVRDASTTVQVSFLGVPAADLSHVVVRGSRSGLHAGSLRAYSEGDGASFVPAKPFTPGELVTVHAVLVEAGRSTPFAWSFTVAVPDNPGAEDVTESTRLDSTPPVPKEYQSFHSRPELRPPDVTVSSTDRTATGGDLFLAPYSGVGQYGPMILNEHGELVWFESLSPAGTRAANLRVQEYEGKPVLTWWQDPLVADGSKTAGEVIANSAYQTVAIVRAGNGYQPDLHEFQITPQGTALITVYDAIDCNLSAVGGPRDGAVADTLLQEIDLKTGLVMYEWHSLDHVPLAELLRIGRADEQGRTVRLLPHQLDRRRAGRRSAGRLAQHLGGVRRRARRPARWAGSWAASTRASSWAPAPRRRGSTTRSSSPTARSRSSTTARPPSCTRSRARSN